MSLRRIERAALGAPIVLKAISGLKFNCATSSLAGKITSDFHVQFMPLLRYHNQKLVWEWEQNDKNSVYITFTDNTTQSIELEATQQSHLLMEAILNIDSSKHTLKDKY